MRQFINNYLEALSPLIPLIVIIVFYLQKKTKAAIALFIHYLSSFALCLWIVILSFKHQPNIHIYTALGIISFCSLSIFLYLSLKKTNNKKLVAFLSIVYILFFFANVIFWENNSAFNSIGFATGSLFILMSCFIYFKERLILLDLQNTPTVSNIWVFVSFLFYYVGSFFIFLTYKILTQKGIHTNLLEERKSLGTLWGIHNIIYFISCLIATFGLLLKKFQVRFT